MLQLQFDKAKEREREGERDPPRRNKSHLVPMQPTFKSQVAHKLLTTRGQKNKRNCSRIDLIYVRQRLSKTLFANSQYEIGLIARVVVIVVIRNG